MRLPADIEAELQAIELAEAGRGGQHAGTPRLRGLRSAIEVHLKGYAEEVAELRTALVMQESDFTERIRTARLVNEQRLGSATWAEADALSAAIVAIINQRIEQGLQPSDILAGQCTALLAILRTAPLTAPKEIKRLRHAVVDCLAVLTAEAPLLVVN